jgi:hypothetical protein
MPNTHIFLHYSDLLPSAIKKTCTNQKNINVFIKLNIKSNNIHLHNNSCIIIIV